jgi:hypothetical protein
MGKGEGMIFGGSDGEPSVSLQAAGSEWARLANPIRVHFLGGPTVLAEYGSVREDGDGWIASASVSDDGGTHLQISDRWTPLDDATIQIERNIRVLRSGGSRGVRVEFRPETSFDGPHSPEDFQFFIPGALYNRNDTDHDGVEDYLGTYVQDYRDDRLGSLAVMVYLPSASRFVALTRVVVPRFDTSIPSGQLLERHFVQHTDIGSLGIAPLDDRGGQVTLRASYPFSEEYTFCLNTEREGWAAYLDPAATDTADVTYQLSTGAADDLTDAIWAVTTRQMQALAMTVTSPGFSLEESLEVRMSMIQQQYREWTADEDPRRPAGFMVHFSPRTARPNGTVLEYGFSGAQTLLAYDSIRFGRQQAVPLYVERGRAVIDFFVQNCVLPNGYAHGIYDVARHDFVYWFTGILMPFHYSSDEADVRRYLGRQVATALAPIAAELRQKHGNYTRTMCESFYWILRAHQLERERGVVHDAWRAASLQFGEFLLSTQAEDGSWRRAYSPEGEGLDSPPAWFGASDTERKSGTIFPVPVLVELFNATEDQRYLDAAERAGRFIASTYVDSVEYLGGLNDTTHIKSVKIDAIGVMSAMRSLLRVYDVTGRSEFLDAAVKAARVLSSWVYLWDVPFPEESLLAKGGFRSTGWAGCDVIPAGSYLDDEFPEFIPDLLRIAGLCQDPVLFDVARAVQNGMQYALSTPDNMYGYALPGIQCEGIMTGYWMSDPDDPEFSGAANKVKGDDNDTCNGLVNGQAVFGIYELLDTYGTSDFEAIREQLFGPPR